MDEKLQSIKQSLKMVILIVISLITGVCLMVSSQYFFQFFINERHEGISGAESLAWGATFLNGVIGTFISAGTLVFVALTYSSQKKELKETQKELKTQRFESVFFNMLDMIYKMGEGMWMKDHSLASEDKVFHTYDGQRFFRQFMIVLKAFYRKNYIHEIKNDQRKEELSNYLAQRIYECTEDETFKIAHIDYYVYHKQRFLIDISKVFKWAERPENELLYIQFLYQFFFDRYSSQLGHFFRYIFNTIKYVEENWNDFESQSKYVNLIQAQLSNHQLAVMFYNCLSPVSYNKDNLPAFKDLVEKFDLLQNLQPSLLMDPEHQKYYELNFKHRYKTRSNETEHTTMS